MLGKTLKFFLNHAQHDSNKFFSSISLSKNVCVSWYREYMKGIPFFPYYENVAQIHKRVLQMKLKFFVDLWFLSAQSNDNNIRRYLWLHEIGKM